MGGGGGAIRASSLTLIWTPRAGRSSVQPSWCLANDAPPPLSSGLQGQVLFYRPEAEPCGSDSPHRAFKRDFIALLKVQFAFSSYHKTRRKTHHGNSLSSDSRALLNLQVLLSMMLRFTSTQLHLLKGNRSLFCSPLRSFTEVIRGSGPCLRAPQKFAIKKVSTLSREDAAVIQERADNGCKHCNRTELLQERSLRCFTLTVCRQ